MLPFVSCAALPLPSNTSGRRAHAEALCCQPYMLGVPRAGSLAVNPPSPLHFSMYLWSTYRPDLVLGPGRESREEAGGRSCLMDLPHSQNLGDDTENT